MLEGKLVNLRAQEIGDLERIYRWINDRDVSRFLGARYEMPLPFERDWLQKRAGSPLSFGRAFFAIETKDGVHIGDIGLHEASGEDRKAWLGMRIGETQYWSRGYGSDALITLVRFAFEEMNLNRVSLDVYDFNPRAITAYRNCGLVEEGRRRAARYSGGAYHDIVSMGVLRGQWQRPP